MKTSKAWIVAGAVVLGCLWLGGGCGGKKNAIDGQYADARSGLLTIEFNSGDCDIRFAGMSKHCTYEFSGDTITVRRASDGVVEMTLTRKADGSLVDRASGNSLVRVGK